MSYWRKIRGLISDMLPPPTTADGCIGLDVLPVLTAEDATGAEMRRGNVAGSAVNRPFR